MLSGFSSTFEALSDRLRHPLLGTYIVSWSVYNWDVWPHWSADTPAGVKVAALRELVTACDMIMPFLIACATVLLRPWIGLLIAKATCGPEVRGLKAIDELRQARLKAQQDEHSMAVRALDAKRSTLSREVDELDTLKRHTTQQVELAQRVLAETTQQHVREQDAFGKLQTAGQALLANVCASHFGIDVAQHRDLQNQINSLRESYNNALTMLRTHGIDPKTGKRN